MLLEVYHFRIISVYVSNLTKTTNQTGVFGTYLWESYGDVNWKNIKEAVMQKIRAFQVYQCADETWLKCLEAGCDQFFFTPCYLPNYPTRVLSITQGRHLQCLSTPQFQNTRNIYTEFFFFSYFISRLWRHMFKKNGNILWDSI